MFSSASSTTNKTIHQLGSRLRSGSKGNRSNSKGRERSLHKNSDNAVDTVTQTQTVKSHFYDQGLRHSYNTEIQNSSAVHGIGWYPPKNSTSSNQGSRMRFRQVTNESQQTSRVRFVKPEISTQQLAASHIQRSTENSPISRVSSPKVLVNQSIQHQATFRPQTTAVVYPMKNVTERESELLRKLKVVQERVIQLQAQKQSVQSVLTEENRRLFHENNQLKKKLDTANLEQTKSQLEELESMLEKQISKSLELMEQNESLKQYAVDSQSKLEHNTTEWRAQRERLLQRISKAEERQTQVNSQLQQTFISHQQQVMIHNLELCTLKDKLSSLQTELTKKEEQFNYKQNQAQERLDQLQMNCESQLQEKQSEIQELKKVVFSHELKLETLEEEMDKRVKSNWMNNSGFNNSGMILNSSAFSMDNSGLQMPFDGLASQQEEKKCSKCTQLLKTVFKLNNHLNKSGQK